jgi:hypothetical protein
MASLTHSLITGFKILINCSLFIFYPTPAEPDQLLEIDEVGIPVNAAPRE